MLYLQFFVYSIETIKLYRISSIQESLVQLFSIMKLGVQMQVIAE